MGEIQKIETWLEGEDETVKTELDAVWTNIKPGVLALGKTVLSQILQLAETFILSGGNTLATEQALAAIVPQDTVAAKAIVSAAFSVAIANLTSATPAPTPTITAATPPAPAAS